MTTGRIMNMMGMMTQVEIRDMTTEILTQTPDRALMTQRGKRDYIGGHPD